MSFDYHVYLGPYLECEYTLIPDQNVKWACGNKRCVKQGLVTRNKEANFCPVCGKLLAKQIEVIEKPNVDSWEVREEIDEVLTPIPLEYIELDSPYHIWIPNVTRDPPRRFYYDPRTDYCVEPLGRANFHLSEVVWLAETFMKEMKILKKHYKECLGQWGLLIYPY